MFERDYLMKLILGYFKTIVIVIKQGEKEKDPEGAADLLEQAIGEATEIDGEVLLSLAPESIASVLQVSGTDPKVVGYVAHGLLLATHLPATIHHPHHLPHAPCRAGKGGILPLHPPQTADLADKTAYGLSRVTFPDKPVQPAHLVQPNFPPKTSNAIGKRTRGTAHPLPDTRSPIQKNNFRETNPRTRYTRSPILASRY